MGRATLYISLPTRGVNSVARAFTLVELMVVLVIVAMLAALTLAGLSGVRDRAKADKTRSTIRKLHEIVIPHFESYQTRRTRTFGSAPTIAWSLNSRRFVDQPAVTITSSANAATNRLWGLRTLQALEMPDQWADVAPVSVSGSPIAVPKWAVTAPVKRYGTVKWSPSDVATPEYESAECLAMIVMRGGVDAGAVESFRADELGDVDGDRRPEIIDGWGKPIGFIRSPVGFDSPLLIKSANVNPDPLDPMRRSEALVYPTTAAAQTDYGVVPLIFSAGSDGSIEASSPAANYGGYAASSETAGSALVQLGLSSGAITIPMTVPSNRNVISVSSPLRPGEPANASWRDNITNYDMLKK